MSLILKAQTVSFSVVNSLRLLIIALCLISVVFVTSPIHAKDADLVLSKSVEYYMGGRVEPRQLSQQFDCHARIYATLTSKMKPGQEQTVLFKWFAPNGKLALLQKTAFDDRLSGDYLSNDPLNMGADKILEEKTRFISKWFALSSAGLLSAFSADNAYNEYIGSWKVLATLNDKTVASQAFEILC